MIKLIRKLFAPKRREPVTGEVWMKRSGRWLDEKDKATIVYSKGKQVRFEEMGTMVDSMDLDSFLELYGILGAIKC